MDTCCPPLLHCHKPLCTYVFNLIILYSRGRGCFYQRDGLVLVNKEEIRVELNVGYSGGIWCLPLFGLRPLWIALGQL